MTHCVLTKFERSIESLKARGRRATTARNVGGNEAEDDEDEDECHETEELTIDIGAPPESAFRGMVACFAMHKSKSVNGVAHA